LGLYVMTVSLRCNWLNRIFVTVTLEIFGCPVVLGVPLNCR
jgi:hypothetical protein